ncbi:MAG: ATP-dependent sacrificial sulfur transferase LarE [Candidatus Rifleibacteriota bacterium]
MFQQLKKLEKYLLDHENVAVAFSGGMDSTFLTLMARKVMPDNYRALLVNSEFMAQSELNIARSIAEKNKLNLKEIRIDVLTNAMVCCNDINRCYHCKKAIFSRLLEEAGSAVLCDGSVTDDDNDYRPGKKALKELKIKSPLKDCGFSKELVAKGLKQLGAAELIRPAQSCLATRIVTHETIEKKKLEQIEQGEKLLRKAGLRFFRLRHHNDIARIEVGCDELDQALEKIKTVVCEIKNLGYRHVTLDLEGYNKGSMNR